MSSIFGLGPAGFTALRQSDWVAYFNQKWTDVFGAQVNLDPRSVNGQLIAIFSERLALLSEGIEGVANALNPAGAEGLAVDNLLALGGLTRKPAQPTTTQSTPQAQANGVTLYGLVLFGTPGTTVPAGSQVSDSAQPPHLFTTDQAITIAPAANAQQQVVFSTAPTAGTYALTLTSPAGLTLTTQPISYAATGSTTQLSWPTPLSSGTYSLSLAPPGSATVVTGALSYSATAAAVAAAINAALGTQGVAVAGSVAAGMVITWPTGAVPLCTPSSDPAAPQAVNPVQAAINALAQGGVLPFTDVAAAFSPGLVLSFGAFPPASGQPASGAAPVPLLQVATSSLTAGAQVVNLAASVVVQGAPAQGIGSATATTTGAATVPAKTLTTIGTPTAGWTGVTNQLDCVPGSDVETDSEALLRRANLQAALAQGPLAAIIQRVSGVSGVASVTAFANTTGAAQQILTFGAGATGGTFSLLAGGTVTGAIPANPTAAQVQAALAALPGYGAVTATGNAAYGITVDFGGAMGGQAQPLMQVGTNTTGASVTVAYGRPPKSVEMVVTGGSNDAVAAAIFAAAPAGITTYGAPVLTTTAQVVAGSATLTVASSAGISTGLAVTAYGVPVGTRVTSLSGNQVTLSQPAISSYSNASCVFTNAAALTDSSGNQALVSFSRPQPVPIQVTVSLTTDQYIVPGNPASGRNLGAQWAPASVATVQAAIAANINAVPVGGLVVAQGSSGVLASFANVPGIVGFTLAFGTGTPTQAANIQMLPAQEAVCSPYLVAVSYV